MSSFEIFPQTQPKNFVFYRIANSQVVTSGPTSLFIFDTKVIGNTGTLTGYDTKTGEFTAPFDGFYTFNFNTVWAPAYGGATTYNTGLIIRKGVADCPNTIQFDSKQEQKNNFCRFYFTYNLCKTRRSIHIKSIPIFWI